MEIARKSHVADPILFEHAGKVDEFLKTDLPQFTAYDVDLNAAKQTLLKTSYENALTFGTDKAQLGAIKVATFKLAAEFRNCISVFKDVRYFTRKCFKNTPYMLNYFPFSSYKEARKSVTSMVVFMEDLKKAVNDHKTELLAAGLKQTVIDSIETARIALANSNTVQETGKTGRNVNTQERIELINTLYDILMEFSSAAKIIFANNPAYLSKYMMPYSSGTDNVEPESAS